jgi:hypothetical protein
MEIFFLSWLLERKRIRHFLVVERVRGAKSMRQLCDERELQRFVTLPPFEIILKPFHQSRASLSLPQTTLMRIN